MLADSIDRSDRDAIDTVGVAIKIAVVLTSSAIASGEHEDATKTTSTILNTVLDRLFDQHAWRIHGLTVVGRSP